MTITKEEFRKIQEMDYSAHPYAIGMTPLDVEAKVTAKLDEVIKASQHAIIGRGGVVRSR